MTYTNHIIIHHTHYEKSDWPRAFNQFKIACELDMITAISAADIADGAKNQTDCRIGYRALLGKIIVNYYYLD